MLPSRMLDPNALGRPREGIHFHVFGIAIVDLVLTFVAAYFLARWRGWSVWLTFAALMLLGLVVHRIVGVDTTLTRMSHKIL